MHWYQLSPLILQKLIWIPTRIVLVFFGHMHVKGLENLDDLTGNVIFAANHSSEVDPILIPAALPFWSRFSPMFYTSRESGFYKNSGWRRHLYGGLLFKIWGSYPLFAGQRDYEKSMVNHIRIIEDGGNLCIFPEGRTTPDGTIQQAHGGTAYLAERTKCPIVPVGICCVFKMSVRDFLQGKVYITIHFGKPIFQDELRVQVDRATAPADHYYRDEAEYVMGKVEEAVLSA